MIKGNLFTDESINTKKSQRKTGVSNIFSQLDIKFVLKKFSELEKLKMLLLNENQYHLFEYLPKPVILKNSKVHFNYTNKKIEGPIKKSTTEIIHHNNDSIMKVKVVQKAYNAIINQENMSDLDRKLIESLDDDILNILANPEMAETKIMEKTKQLELEQFSIDREKESIFSEKREESKINVSEKKTFSVKQA